MPDVSGGLDGLAALALCVPRPLGAMLLMPVFSPSNLGGTLVRNALVLMIALPVLPTSAPWMAVESTAWEYALLISSEIGIGLLIGFCGAIPFWALDMAGFLIDTLRGASMASVFNPLIEQPSSYFGILFSQFFGLLFLVSGGFGVFISAIHESYVILPPGQSFFSLDHGAGFLMVQWQLMHELCLRFSMPALIVFLLIDVAFGFVNRAAPQLNVFFLSMPVKSVLVLLMLIMSLGFAVGGLLDLALSLADRTGMLLGPAA